MRPFSIAFNESADVPILNSAAKRLTLHNKALSMQPKPFAQESLQALNDLKDIRGIMERSSRFVSLSGWSGIWAGATALLSAFVVWKMNLVYYFHREALSMEIGFDNAVIRLLLLGVMTFLVAFAGAYYFTWRKARASGQRVWTSSSRALMRQVAVPMLAGGMFCIASLYYGAVIFITPSCLVFYGLALVSGSKYTLGEIRWLGYSEVILGSIALFMPNYGLGFMAAGFGILHILYGIIMWNKYDKRHPA
jgi:hypothetical protein